MKKWFALVAIVFVSGCRNADAQPEAETKSRSKWKLTAKDGTISKIVLAPDGDVIAGGPIKGTVDFAGQRLESKENGVWVARLASSGALKWVRLVDPPAKKYTSQYLQALSVAADGSIRVDVDQREAPYLRRVSIAADGATQRVDALVPETRTMASTVVANGDGIVSAEAGKKDKCKGAILQRLQPGGKRTWSVCNNKVDLGALNVIDVAADGRSAMCAHEWLAGFSAAGKRSWEAKHPKGCEKLAIAANGDVVVVYDGPPTQSVTQWKASGKRGWTTPCTTILKGAGNCLLEALVVRGTDVILSVRNFDTSMIAILDATTGGVRKTYPLGIDAAFGAIAATDSSIVFGTHGPSRMTIEALDR
ncbi:MAG: hypothetical protein AB7T06_12065 [Kofleriaceae bacterium]